MLFASASSIPHSYINSLFAELLAFIRFPRCAHGPHSNFQISGDFAQIAFQNTTHIFFFWWCEQCSSNTINRRLTFSLNGRILIYYSIVCLVLCWPLYAGPHAKWERNQCLQSFTSETRSVGRQTDCWPFHHSNIFDRQNEFLLHAENGDWWMGSYGWWDDCSSRLQQFRPNGGREYSPERIPV